MNACVFTGPTLSAAEARTEMEAVYREPVAQGDVCRAVLQGFRAIGIIDGYFERLPSVWHKEILWAMSQGVHVFGSASMGALRAAELAPFGMEGVGKIFNAYFDGTLEDDDEVAVVHGDAESGHRCSSEAMVNIRATLAAAEDAAILGPATATALARVAKDLFYADRTYPLTLRLAAPQNLPPEELKGFSEWLPAGRVDQKRRDAIAMLHTMRDRLAGESTPKRVHFTLQQTKYWNRALREAHDSVPDVRFFLRQLREGSRSLLDLFIDESD